MKSKKEPKKKPIAILTINEDVSKMNPRECSRLTNWVFNVYQDLLYQGRKYGKCRFRLMK